ncbi:hypothetical protein KAR91_28485 [Candidatus Pacearchaeota archaeon]|nr:hypothetical protein [Candidatus Pacearchaeota archaeon]
MDVKKLTFESKEIRSICPNCQHNFVTSAQGPPKECTTILTKMFFRSLHSTAGDMVFYFDNQKCDHIHLEPGEEGFETFIPIRTVIIKKTNMTYKQWKNRWCKEALDMTKPGRCGTCVNFPGNGMKCSKNTRPKMNNVFANDYGKGHCENYGED